MVLRTDLLNPIPGGNPAGADVRYAPVFDQIKLARTEELDAPQGAWKTARKTADFAQVVKLASDVLATQSKHLQVAGWLTEALAHREGFAGVKAGFDLLRELLEQYWEHAYPEIEDGDLEFRVAPLDWVGLYLGDAIRRIPLNRAGHGFTDYRESRIVGYESDAESDSARAARQEAIEEGKLTAEDFDEEFAATPKSWYKQLVADIEAATEALEALERTCDEKFGDLSPSFLKLRDALKEIRVVAAQLLQQKLENDPDPEVVPMGEIFAETENEVQVVELADPAEQAVPAGGAQTAAVLPVSAGAAPKTRDDAAGRIAIAARFLRQSSPTDPAAYLLLRGFRWGELRKGAGEIEPALLAAPPTEMRTRLRTLSLAEKWAELLEASEELMATPYGRGWLDLQRYVLRACAELGGEYDAVALAVRGALRGLLQDLPQLAGMTLMDDTPCANPETRAWLKAERLLGADPEPDEVAVFAFNNGRSQRDPQEAARELVKARQPQKAIDLLMRQAAQETSARAKFLRRTQAAAIMVDAGLEAVAVPILREMVEQIEKHDLEQWEDGATVAQALGLLLQCLKRLDEDSSTRDELYLRICRLDPMQAIRFTETASNGG
jgi:type VI secretion system protein ImpA